MSVLYASAPCDCEDEEPSRRIVSIALKISDFVVPLESVAVNENLHPLIGDVRMLCVAPEGWIAD